MKKILLLLASVAVLYSCGNGEDNTDPVEPAPEEQPALTVDVTELSFVAEGESKTIKITTNKDWKVSTSADWLDLSPESGVAGEALSVSVTASANTAQDARTAKVTVTADKLTKTISVSQEKAAEEPTPDPGTGTDPDTGATYQRSTDPIMYASGLQDGKCYVMYCKAYDLSSDDPKCWSESQGKLTMKSVNDVMYSATEVFEYKYDASKSSQPYDNYGSYSAGAWKSVSTGKYLDEEFNLDAELEEAMWLEYANNWNNSGGAELNVLDVYKYPYTAGVQTIWYKGGTSFEWGTNANPEGFTHHNRKWVAYEATAINQ